MNKRRRYLAKRRRKLANCQCSICHAFRLAKHGEVRVIMEGEAMRAFLEPEGY